MVGASAGPSLPDLICLLGEIQARDIDLYLHQQALDTSTPSGRMLGVFSEFERAMIRESGDGGTGSSAIIRQAIGQAENDTVHRAAYPCSIG